MKRHVNLMSNGTRVRTIVRTRIRQWSLAYACVVALLVPALLVAWWPVHQASQNVAVLETQYEPIRQLKIASRASLQQIEKIQAQEQTALVLAKIDTPVVTLLGLVGKAVADSQHRVVVEELNFRQDTTIQNVATTDAKPSLELEGYALDDHAINQFRNSLQTAFPFGKVALEFSKPETIQNQPMYRFSIQCAL